MPNQSATSKLYAICNSMMRSTFCLILLAGLLSGCSQMRFLGIETYKPAAVSYPAEVHKVLVVNNAVPQPSDSGYEYFLGGVRQDTCRANADSALFDACRALGKAIVETDFFQDVLLYHENTREDDSFLSDTKLTQEQVASLCEETDADAVISLDRLLFDMKKQVVAFAGGYLYGQVDVRMSGTVRSYLPARETPQATVLVEDSLFWQQDAPALDLLDQVLPGPDDALREAGNYIGGKVYSMFVPHWDRETRWYYTGTGTRWQEATAFAAKEKWEDAREKWNTIYERSSGWKTKAKTAANIALYYEMSGDMDKALEWAGKSLDLFKKNTKENDKLTQYQEAYKEKILERIQDNKKLNLQLGED